MTPPPSLEAQAARQRVERLATLLDSAVMIPGTNVGIGVDALIGLVPVVGDAVALALGAWLIAEARAAGAPRRVLARMAGNLALDGVFGAIPLAGDLFDVAFRANRRNAALLIAHLDGREAAQAARWPWVVAGLALAALVAWMAWPN